MQCLIISAVIWLSWFSLFLCCWCPWTRTDVIKAFWSYLKIVNSRESECAASQVIHRIIIIISKTNRVGPTYAKQLKVQILYYLPVNTGLDYAYIKRSEIYCKSVRLRASPTDDLSVLFIIFHLMHSYLSGRLEVLSCRTLSQQDHFLKLFTQIS